MNLTALQYILFIVALELVSFPIIAFFVNFIIIGYYKAKEAHTIRVLRGIAKVFEEGTKNLMETLDKKIKEKKTDGDGVKNDRS